MNVRYPVEGGEGVGLPCPGSRTPDIHTGHRPFRAKDHGTAGRPVRIRGVADENVRKLVERH
jgi:hypothetical protein